LVGAVLVVGWHWWWLLGGAL